MRGKRLALLVSCALPAMALAQQASAQPAPPPLRNPVDLAAPPATPRLAPSVEGPPLRRQEGPGAAVELHIGTVRITGNEAIEETQLAPAIAGLADSTVPLARIEESRLGILRAYRDRGFPFAAVNAGVTRRPDSNLVDLTFAVTEGFIAEVKLEGDAENIGPAGTQVLRFLNRLIGVRPVSTAAVERALLLASDIPGLTVRGTLRPLQTEPGALQLVAQVERKAVSGYVNIDNRGYRLVGPWQGLFVAGVNSLTSFGERTELSFFGAPNSTQWFAQASVETFLGGSGLRMRLYAGTGETRPSGSLREIGYFGRTTVGGVGLTYPIVRSRPFNLYAVGNFDFFESEVETGTSGRTRASRDAIRILRAGLDAQLLESWLPWFPAATTFGSIRLHQGVTGLGATRNGYPLSGRSGGEDFGFRKLTGEIQRTQPLFSPFEGSLLSVQALFSGQYSDDVLPQAEKYYVGGNRLGRGYYAGQITGDKAWGLALELQFDLGFELPITPALGNNRFAPQFYIFRDIARTVENRRDDPNRRIASWGGGVRLLISDAVQFDLEGVHRDVRRPDGAAADALHETSLIFRTLVRF
ncbi:BamA/TamA family outer membrane protein [Siccirubricoccus sp. KC 17139]|uniref:BamA/TamA family outer membrane protein n=1 Tax=Siccirubricoccus soli TaxID=2899147 RepID=A0ABT1D9Y0_9PROT|nr:ShlB/FhaC/HecB family hemolysin secretion/activation protein [Siccirubricoccus soli]MCO6418711.1 BamA/TamA family outer membrane protein [Siccirubricoccus soli]MCP2684846.1 BamA/TamA family outer membrane protein [Siccirubricoccus soli]